MGPCTSPPIPPWPPRALRDGHLAALPTETVYGLGARADLPHAIARVYAAKGRPADHPLIVHVRDADGPRRVGPPTVPRLRPAPGRARSGPAR